MQGNVTRIKPRPRAVGVRTVAGRPITTQQQSDILWSAYSQERTQRELERADADESIFEQFMKAMGRLFVGALLVAAVLLVAAIVVNLKQTGVFL